MAPSLLHRDILIIIIEELNWEAPDSLRGLRLVSKQVDSLVVPYVYYTTRVTPNILAAVTFDTPTYKRQVTADVCKFARHLVINQRLEPLSLLRLLENMQKLESFTWSFWDEDTHLYIQTRRALFSRLGHMWPQAGMICENVSLSTVIADDFAALPPGQLHALYLNGDDPVFPVQHLLVEQTNLKVLDVDVAQLRMPDSGELLLATNLPAIETLVLRCTPVDILFEGWRFDLWNWSEIRHLKLLGQNLIFDPTLVIPWKYLLSLQTLVSEWFYGPPRVLDAWSDRVCRLVSQAAGLEELGVGCHYNAAFFAAVRAQAGSLKVLHLSDPPDKELEAIGEACIHLVEITVKGNLLHTYPLGQFKNLRRFTMTTQTFRDRWRNKRAEDVNPSLYLLQNRASVRKWVSDLVDAKRGSPFEEIVIHMKFIVTLKPRNQEETSFQVSVSWTYDRALSGPEAAPDTVLQEATDSVTEVEFV